MFRHSSQGSDISFAFLRGGFGSGSFACHPLEHLGIYPCHAVGTGLFAGNECLDFNAHLGEHALVLGADVPLRLVLVEIVGDPLDVVAGGGEILHAVPEQVIIVGLEVDLAAVLGNSR